MRRYTVFVTKVVQVELAEFDNDYIEREGSNVDEHLKMRALNKARSFLKTGNKMGDVTLMYTAESVGRNAG